MYVYILQSLDETHPNRTYVGYTINLKQRLRKHNGEIKGGAKYTRVGRPYIIHGYVEGFADKSEALSFEWHCHHPAGRPRKRGKGNLRTRFDKYKGVERREKIMKYLMKQERWNHLKLVQV